MKKTRLTDLRLLYRREWCVVRGVLQAVGEASSRLLAASWCVKQFRLVTFDLRLLYRDALAFLTVGGIVCCQVPALAAERIVLKYLVFRESIAVEDLTNFARTGEMSADLRVNLALARQDPQVIRQSLTNAIAVEPILLDRVLNHPVGEFLLDEIGKTVHPPSRRANRQALRAAVILSARDRQLSLLEILQNYPTTEVEVEGDRLEAVSSQLRRLEETLKSFLK